MELCLCVYVGFPARPIARSSDCLYFTQIHTHNIHIQTNKHTHKHTHTQTHTHKHTHTQTHTHTHTGELSKNLLKNALIDNR